MRHTISAQHCSGQSVAHACRRGVYEDPIDLMPSEIEAESHEAAEIAAQNLLEHLVESAEPCTCERSRSIASKLGSSAWYASVSISATSEPEEGGNR